MNNTFQPTFAASLLSPVELVTPPAFEPVELDEVREQVEVYIEDDDLLLGRKVTSAIDYLQENRGRQFAAATFDVRVAAWWSGLLRLPRAPLASVTSVKYYDQAGVLQTLAADQYVVNTPYKQAGSIELLLRTFNYQPLDRRQFPIVVRFVAGRASAELVSATAKEAIYLMVTHLYQNRAAEIVVPQAIESMLDACCPAGYA